MSICIYIVALPPAAAYQLECNDDGVSAGKGVLCASHSQALRGVHWHEGWPCDAGFMHVSHHFPQTTRLHDMMSSA